MATDHAASVMGVSLRVTQLNADGTPATGTTTCWQTNAFMKFGFTPQYTTGTDVEEKGADGNICVYFKTNDVLKNLNFTLSICAPDPELYQMLTGGTVLTTLANTVDATGYASAAIGVDGTPNGVGLEVWSRAIVSGRPAVVNPYWRWIFPFCKMKFSGDHTMENGALASAFEGWGYGNASFGGGPTGDWQYTTASCFQYARAATAPLGVNGYLTVTSHSNAIQSITISGKPTGGTYTLTYGGSTTGAIAFNASPATVQGALQSLASIGTGDVSVAIGTVTGVPTLTKGTTSTSGGTLASGATYWVVTATGPNGESLASNEVTATLTGSTSSQPLSWTAVTGATTYNVYRGTSSGGEAVLVIAQSAGSGTTYTDVGAAGSAGAPPINGGPYLVTFQGILGDQIISAMTTSASLTGGTSPAVTIAVVNAGN